MSSRGLISARDFSAAVAGLDTLYRIIILESGASQTVGLAIDSHLEHRCFIAHFLASDEFRQVAGPLVKSHEAVEAIKTLVEVLNSSMEILEKAVGFGLATIGSGILGFEKLSNSRIDREAKKLHLKIDHEKLQQEVLRTARLHDLKINSHAKSPVAELFADEQIAKKTLAALGSLLRPLIVGDATMLSLDTNGGTPATLSRALVEDATASFRRQPSNRKKKSTRLSIASTHSELSIAPASALEMEDRAMRSGVVHFVTLQLGGQRSGWRITLNNDKQIVEAEVLDIAFLGRVMNGQQVVTARDSFVAEYRLSAPDTGTVELLLINPESRPLG